MSDDVIKSQIVLCNKASILADALIKAMGEPMTPEYRKMVDEYIDAKERYSKALENDGGIRWMQI